jgi:tetratricopeptide (TPR) repeat protein
VIGKGASQEAEVFGDTPNVAARVEASAEPGTVAISEAAQRLVSGLFVIEDLGLRALKGIEQPVQLYRVVRSSGARGRFQAATAARGLTPFVGRADELRSLTSRWERVLDGEGQVALIIGEAGIGKSRLVQRFHERIADTPHTWVEAGAGAFFQNTPFYPVTEMLMQLLSKASPQDRITELERLLTTAGLRPSETVPLISPLLNLQLPASYPPSALSSEQQRRRMLATLVEFVLGSARLRPLVLAIEDLHWADPSTLELIHLLVDQGATERLLLLYTARPEFRAQWAMRAHHAQITLNRLGVRDIRAMVAEVAASKALTDETITVVVERTGGIPLFVEELTRAVLESGNEKLTGREIPTTLQDSLMARLDRLGPAKDVAQIAAVIGREFSYELLHAIHPIAEEDLQRSLARLTEAELVYVRGIAPDATYQFKHALVQDAAYEALLKTRRKELHLIAARTIDQKFPSIKETHPEVLARHWTEAGETKHAIAAWKSAGDIANTRRAFREAEEGYRQALAMLSLLPESSERDMLEFDLSSPLSQVLGLTRGFSTPEAIDAAARASALSEKNGNLAQLILQGTRTWTTLFISGDHRGASALADQLMDLARREGSKTSLGFAHYMQLSVRYYRGDLVGVEEHFACLNSFIEAPGMEQIPAAIVVTIGFASLGAFAWGRADQARERIARGISYARDSKNPYEVVTGRYYESWLYRFMREPLQAKGAAAEVLALSEEHGFPFFKDIASSTIGWARAQLGEAEGVEQIRQGLSSLTEIGARLSIMEFRTCLAEAQALHGQIDDALNTIEEALQTNPDELLYRPELFRVRGELRLERGQTELAEAGFREAIALAQTFRTKSWELRATTSLARLLAMQGRRDEARTMLADIYNWFTEGFDTADLKDAKTLLEQLAT